MTDRRSHSNDDIEKLKRTNRRRLAGASVMVLVAGVLLGKALDSDNQEAETQNVSIVAERQAASDAPASEQEGRADKQEADIPRPEKTTIEFVPDADTPIDRLSDEELQRIIAQGGNARQPEAAREMPSEKPPVESVAAVSFPKMPEEGRVQSEKQRAVEQIQKANEERRLKEKKAEEGKRSEKKQAEAREAERKKKADEERRLKERKEAEAKRAAELKKREVERKSAEKTAERKENGMSKLAEAERRAAELRKQAADAERRAAELKKQAETKRQSEGKKAEKKADTKPVAKPDSKADKDRKANIQAGAFRDLEQAKQMKKRLNDAGIIVDITTVNTDKGKVYRVRTGSYPNKEAAERALGRLKEKGINGKVIEK